MNRASTTSSPDSRFADQGAMNRAPTSVSWVGARFIAPSPQPRAASILPLVKRLLPGLALGLGLWACGAGAAEIRQLTSTLEQGQLSLSFHLAGAFEARLFERLESGLPTEIRYRITLQKDRKRWFDSEVASTELVVVAMYDALRREYLVNTKLAGELIESRMVHDLARLEDAMTRIDRLPVFATTPDPASRRLLVRVRAELGTRHLLGLIPSLVATDWAEAPYPTAAAPSPP
jgi:hypothetical protein